MNFDVLLEHGKNIYHIKKNMRMKNVKLKKWQMKVEMNMI
jgi:hypothetical protein